jgi:hypothetical protein
MTLSFPLGPLEFAGKLAQTRSEPRAHRNQGIRRAGSGPPVTLRRVEVHRRAAGLGGLKVLAAQHGVGGHLQQVLLQQQLVLGFAAHDRQG